MSVEPVRLLILGAHPDDAEFHAGGLATIYRQQGAHVKLVSVTDGRSGHHVRQPEELIALRRQESLAAANVIGAECSIWDFPDGELEPTLEVRQRIIREIRTFRPDLVLTHRPCDYHPDHRAVGQAVQDASYMVTVPLVVPDVPALRRDPVVAYLPDLFTRPYPLAADVVVDVTEQVSTIIEMLACHESQVFEFLPFMMELASHVPTQPQARRHWLREWYGRIIRPRADRFREALIRQYGWDRGGRIEWVEAFEVSQYATQLDESLRARLFGFLPHSPASSSPVK